ncbi:hypothetical protein Ciccas_000908 [Cichlidogyrus casuarinus]|uniref:phosphatidylinositol N-acetylglucosaminyltransferase n=1 Tax=Cichlidogyrus casuarinus TaxID=1844966 RepID=A0ABD2QLL2_9PLAT
MNIFGTKVEKRPFNIAMVCDFFHPNVGGVEGHIYQLAQCLILRGHKVVVVTHSYGNEKDRRHGVRHMPRGLKIYHIPWKAFFNQVIFITVLGTLPILREIFIREQIEIVHAHSAFSVLGNESLMHATALNLHTVMTDHSLFGFADLSSILTNQTLEMALLNTDKVICVSHTSKENTVLRANLKPEKVYVIPNAIDPDSFQPDIEARDCSPDKITVVVISRLVYRKGSDLLAAIIPPLCHTYPELNFIIGGDGPKLLGIEEVRESHQLHSRVRILGSVPHHTVRDVLVQGDIFLNTSLTEAFCIAIVEAASCGLPVVTTSVGGIREVLPPHMVHLSAVSASELASVLAQTIEEIKLQKTQRSKDEQEKALWERHNEVKNFYSWPKVAERTEIVYESAIKCPTLSFNERISRYYTLGPVFGKFVVFIMFLQFLLLHLLTFLRPRKKIDLVPWIGQNKYKYTH